MKNRVLALAAAAAMGAGAFLSPAPNNSRAPSMAVSQEALRRILSGAGFSLSSGRRGPGWTAANVKRMAKKRRNQQSHRRACRKGGAA